VIGYNLYRGTVSGGPYAKLNGSILSGTTYTDSAIQSGATYYYVSTSVNSDSEESAYSNEASATIP
jgi:fibronectin type 3 domain-containing protein